MKKKMWFVLCIMTSVLLTTACGEKKEPGEEKKETAVQTETAMQTETAVQTETESDQDFQGRESLKLGLFTVYYPEEWKYDKERMQEDDDYSYVRFFDGETADDSGNSIYIEATKEDAYKYRKGLIAFGVDLKEYAEGKAETVSIGNAEYAVMPENDSGRCTYMYRHEQSGTSYDIRVEGEAASDSVKELLEGIVMELKDEGNEDAGQAVPHGSRGRRRRRQHRDGRSKSRQAHGRRVLHHRLPPHEEGNARRRA